MTTDQLQILIVEDEAILALDLRAQLQQEGYRVVGIAPSGERALSLFAEHRVDLVLCDISIKGEIDGIETARQLLDQRPVPLIYLTAFSDAATLERARQTTPASYLVKPVSLSQLRVAIELAISNIAISQAKSSTQLSSHEVVEVPVRPLSVADRDLNRDTLLQIDDYLFVKNNYQFVRVLLADVQYLEADSAYVTLITTSKKYALRLSLTQVLDRINYPRFVRLHRSYAVNIGWVEAFNEHEVTVAGQPIPMGRSYRDEFINRFTFR